MTKPTKVKSIDLLSAIKNLDKNILDGISENDLDNYSISLPNNLTEDELTKLYSTVEINRQILEKHKKKFESDKQNWEGIRLNIETEKSAHAESMREIKDQQEQNTELNFTLKEKEKDLNRREIEIIRREANAELGFTDLLKPAIDEFKNRVAGYQKELLDLETELAHRQVRAIQTLQAELEIWSKTEVENIKSSQSINNDEFVEIGQMRKDLQQDQRQFLRDRIALEGKQRMLAKESELMEETINQRVNAESEQTRLDLEKNKQDLLKEQDKNKKLEEKMGFYNALEKAYGKDPKLAIEKFKKLEEERDEHRKKLESYPSDSEIARLRDLDTKQTEWDNQRWQLESQVAELNQELVKRRMSAMEMQNLREEKDSLEATTSILRDNINSLRNEIDRRIHSEKDEDKTFPNCLSFDSDNHAQDHVETAPITSLKAFAYDIRMRIAKSGLYYTEKDIRSFLGGLAMGQLLILQGISGTGKTSMPVEFAKIVNGGRNNDNKYEGFEVVEVQAGWRDRDDLIGYYNAFEKKFYEKKFLQALYQAQCEAYKDRIYIILLDEMNLSYVEQYFADFLSALESPDENGRKIDLITRADPNRTYPRLFINDNRSILIPQNVWFAGTSNQDETTKDIADKTYDRAHIMELPSTHIKFTPPESTASSDCISYKSLISAFGQAAKNKENIENSVKTWTFFDALHPFLNINFNIGWGNRLEKQFKRYAPVVFACDGDEAEAADAILMSKVLRKIRGKYDNRLEYLDKLETEIQTAWAVVMKKDAEKMDKNFPRSFSIIEKEKLAIINRQ